MHRLILKNKNLKNVCDLAVQISDPFLVAQDPWSNQRVVSLLRAMSSLTLNDVGMTLLEAQACPRNQCFEIFSNENIQLAVFIIPGGQKLHLHDHPGMAVISKLLVGELQVSSYSQIGPREELGIPVELSGVERKRHDIDDPWCLSALVKNFHEFTAIGDPCVVFEALFPPYGDDHRECTYYNISSPLSSPLSSQSAASDKKKSTSYLVPVPPPADGPIAVHAPVIPPFVGMGI